LQAITVKKAGKRGDQPVRGWKQRGERIGDGRLQYLSSVRRQNVKRGKVPARFPGRKKRFQGRGGVVNTEGSRGSPKGKGVSKEGLVGELLANFEKGEVIKAWGKTFGVDYGGTERKGSQEQSSLRVRAGAVPYVPDRGIGKNEKRESPANWA